MRGGIDVVSVVALGALACIVAEIAVGVDVAARQAGSSGGSIEFLDAGIAGGAACVVGSARGTVVDC